MKKYKRTLKICNKEIVILGGEPIPEKRRSRNAFDWKALALKMRAGECVELSSPYALRKLKDACTMIGMVYKVKYVGKKPRLWCITPPPDDDETPKPHPFNWGHYGKNADKEDA